MDVKLRDTKVEYHISKISYHESRLKITIPRSNIIIQDQISQKQDREYTRVIKVEKNDRRLGMIAIWNEG